jgi:hypothetical protein
MFFYELCRYFCRNTGASDIDIMKQMQRLRNDCGYDWCRSSVASYLSGLDGEG